MSIQNIGRVQMVYSNQRYFVAPTQARTLYQP